MGRPVETSVGLAWSVLVSPISDFPSYANLVFTKGMGHGTEKIFTESANVAVTVIRRGGEKWLPSYHPYA